MKVVQTDEFSYWFLSLRDQRAKSKILARIKRLELGNPGDVEPVGEGVSEMKIHYGPGYRIYYKTKTDHIVLCGGDKSTQAKDIQRAKKIASQL